jgi:putative transposase
LDALVVKVRDQGVVRNKHIFVAMGINVEGAKEVLGIWMETNEGAKLWLKVLTELKNRGLQDALVVCCDGLKGFAEAIETALPRATVQTCIVHLIRASVRHVPDKEMKAVAKALRPIYTAASEEAAIAELQAFEATYGKDYPSIVASWYANWTRIVPFLHFPPKIRRVIYTTNAIESLNPSLGKAIRNRGHFPTDDAALKLLYVKLVYVALVRAEKKWKRPFRDWKKVAQPFAIYFDNRLPL